MANESADIDASLHLKLVLVFENNVISGYSLTIPCHAMLMLFFIPFDDNQNGENFAAHPQLGTSFIRVPISDATMH